MKNQKIKMILRLLVCTVVSFICIYLLVFCGGWKFLESGDPILLEIAVSIIVGIIIWIIFGFSRYYDCKLKALEERIEKLEKK